MLQILVNNMQVQPLQQIPEVISVAVTYNPFFPVHIQQGQGKPIMDWVYDLTQRATGTVQYNGVIINKADINKPVK